MHAAPDMVPRAQNWLELGEAARATGLVGLVLTDPSLTAEGHVVRELTSD
jgi:hypothetical protein